MLSARAVPSRWRSFPISKQGDDYACGLHCVAAAAVYHETLVATTKPDRALLRRLPPLDRQTVRARISNPKGPKGLRDRDLRTLAHAVGLALYRPQRQRLEQFEEHAWMWLALVRYEFVDPAGLQASYSFNHYVVILEYKRDSDLVVVADPHPWHPSVYSLAVADFEKAWRAVRGRRLPWSACVYPAGR